MSGYIRDRRAVSEVGVRELRNDLSRWVHRVEAGEELVITERGRPVARMVPAAIASALDHLIAEGLAEPPRMPMAAGRGRPRVPAQGSVSDLVRRQRR